MALLGGVAVALQRQFMGIMNRKMGTGGALLVNYVSGALVVVVFVMATKAGTLRNTVEVPWYALTAGLLGLVIAGSIGFSLPRLRLATTLTFVIAAPAQAQFVVALVLEHYGLFSEAKRPIDTQRLIGTGGLTFSVWLLTKP
ncbi:DMT family transporter [Roseobacter sp.]|uniref:DMT family transporter n=1 Tax=Roseobacter sp. TaxID=1907202 RepID=UPI002965F7F3|nr:DMT family transporter [Roseobacter sp.]MDW3182714.1 DMT family transporter [Roseobacter sp.]